MKFQTVSFIHYRAVGNQKRICATLKRPSPPVMKSCLITPLDITSTPHLSKLIYGDLKWPLLTMKSF